MHLSRQRFYFIAKYPPYFTLCCAAPIAIRYFVLHFFSRLRVAVAVAIPLATSILRFHLAIDKRKYVYMYMRHADGDCASSSASNIHSYALCSRADCALRVENAVVKSE